MGAIRCRSFNDPDAQRDLPLAEIRIARIGPHTIGYGVERPGWRWSTHMGPRAGRDIGGVAVQVVARIMAFAGPSEVFASAVTVGLADGSGLAFEGQGHREVKGLDRPIQVYRLV